MLSNLCKDVIMPKVIVVSKTHLDLGFTDYAKNILDKYINDFIPNSINTAMKVNNANEVNFVWTTGSWLIKEALKRSSAENQKRLVEALKLGYIAPHSMAFTTHSELMTPSLMEYGLDIVDIADEITGRKTIAAKMTDVPGHTIAMVPYLAKKGIKLLHIGVNGASALPNVPPCFVWKYEDSEVIVIYSGDYGGEFSCPYIEDVLYFDHTLDNHGVSSTEKIYSKLNSLKKDYPNHTVVAGRLDDYAELLWTVKDKLPIITNEIGDTWIHGVATDPFKVGAYKILCSLADEWLKSGKLKKGTEEYINLFDNLLCVCEHTWGMDMKCYFADYENYLKKDFNKARIADKVKIKHLFRHFPQNMLTFLARLMGRYKNGSYKVIEKSWEEQREYISKAIVLLPNDLKMIANEEIGKLLPNIAMKIDKIDKVKTNFEYNLKGTTIAFNSFGGITKLCFNKDETSLVKENNFSPLSYISYGEKDYQYWLNNYTRNYSSTYNWAVGDFARPLLKYQENKYPVGKFFYYLTDSTFSDDKGIFTFLFSYTIDEKCFKELGAPKIMQIKYEIKENSVKTSILWLDKDASRLTESLHFNLFPTSPTKEITFTKIGYPIKADSVVSMGSRKLFAVSSCNFSNRAQVINYHSPLVSLGDGHILHFDNLIHASNEEGISFILHNNIWGTNFPLWYSDNALSEFEIVPL